MAEVKLKQIKKVYNKDITAVNNLNLEIADKEFVVFVGPSGCGKSTTLRMVAGLESITGGDIHIGDVLVNEVAPKDRDIAMVFQNYALYPHMTVFENMAFALKLRKLPKSEIKNKVLNAAEILGINDLLSRKPKALSGGQRQRVAIGRAIVREPKVFLMDEPLSNLDAKLRNQMRAELIKLRKSIDTTFIYVTHDQTEAMTLGDRIVIMNDGLVQQIGTPQQLFNNPVNLFVASFIGSPQMNLIPAKLNICEGIYCVNIYGIDFILPESKQKMLRFLNTPPKEVIMGIRPEHIIIFPTDTQGSIKAKIEVSEMMGSEIYLHLKLEDTSVTAKIQVQTMDDFSAEPSMDNYIWFTVNNRFMHLFDKETQQNLF